MFTFSVLDRKYTFWASLVAKFKNVCLKWILVPRLIRICRIQWLCSFFLFWTRSTLFGQIWSKKLKLSVLNLRHRPNSQNQSSMVMFRFSVFNWKCHFWASLVQKIKIVSLSWNLVLQQFKYAEFNDAVHFFRFHFASFIQRIYLAFWCYLINSFSNMCSYISCDVSYSQGC